MRYRWIVVTLVIVSLLLTAAWVGLKSIPASLLYEFSAEFTELPPDDTVLEQWLQTQPGVAKATVGMREGEPNKVVVLLVMVRNGWGEPPLPDLDAKCDELGYKGRVDRFRPSQSEKTIWGRPPAKTAPTLK